MPRVVTRQRRAVRAGVFGAVLTVSAVLAHVLAGGMAPGAGVVVGSAGVLCVLGWLLAGRDRSTPVVAAAALVGQVGLHLTFSLAMPGPMSMSSLLCGHVAPGGPSVDTSLMRSRLAPSVPASTSHQMLLMALAHALGGVVVLLGLRAAESLVATIPRLLAAVLVWSLPGVHVPGGRRPPSSGAPFRPRTSPLFVVSPRRGPPVSVCV